MPSLTEYAAFVSKMHATHLSQNDQILHSALGVAGEAGEIANRIKKHIFCGMPAAYAKDIIEEAGDILFYLQWLLEAYGYTLADSLNNNVDKLKKRYPDGWVLGGGIRE